MCRIDGAEKHHDIALVDDNGTLVGKARITESVAPGGGCADLGAGGQAGVGVAIAQMGQDEQSLTARGQSSPSGSALLAVAESRAHRSGPH